MLIVKNKFIPFGTYKAINLFGIVFTKKDLNTTDINHERIHTRQMFEMLIIGYYIWYIVEYLIVRFYHKKQVLAYRDISFEEECYIYDNVINYLDHRKLYAWFKYIKIKSNKD